VRNINLIPVEAAKKVGFSNSVHIGSKCCLGNTLNMGGWVVNDRRKILHCITIL